MDEVVKILVGEYKDKLLKEGLESGLIDYLASLAANSFQQISTLNTFTKVKIDIQVY